MVTFPVNMLEQAATAPFHAAHGALASAQRRPLDKEGRCGSGLQHLCVKKEKKKRKSRVQYKC